MENGLLIIHSVKLGVIIKSGKLGVLRLLENENINVYEQRKENVTCKKSTQLEVIIIIAAAVYCKGPIS